MKKNLYHIANEARGLALDALAKANSGHIGLPLGCADIGAALFGKLLSYNPKEPRWLNRDRLILSAGHGSLFLYTWLHLSGFKLSLDDLKHFRQLNSNTPGHPEFGKTDGVEATTGPLGQGIGNAVGMAVSQKMAAARFNSPNHKIFDNKIVCICGDGCLQEGVACESISLAGHWALDNLILIYDSNNITLDAPLDRTQSEDVRKKFEALNWDVSTIDGHNIEEFISTFQAAKNNNSKPQLIIAKTKIGKGIPGIEGTVKGHGDSGKNFLKEAKESMGLSDESFYVSEETRSFFKEHQQALEEEYRAWQNTFSSWKSAYPEKFELLCSKKELNKEFWEERKLSFNENISTRAAAGKVLNKAKDMPLLISGSADLHGSTKNFLEDEGIFSKEDRTGRNLCFGIREHAMGAIMNGIAYDDIFMPSGATFLVFSDYLRPSIRLAAMSKLPVLYIFTHDSVFVGEDGPTHQPVETVTALRTIPNLQVVRPADPYETIGAVQAAYSSKNAPTALILTRQNVPVLEEIDSQIKLEGAQKGAYVISRESGNLEYLILATGSEVKLAMDVKERLGTNVRVVSMPCLEKFDLLPEEEKERIVPSTCTKKIAIEAGISMPWYKYVGANGLIISIDQFGISAPEKTIKEYFGLNTNSCIEEIKRI